MYKIKIANAMNDVLMNDTSNQARRNRGRAAGTLPHRIRLPHQKYRVTPLFCPLLCPEHYCSLQNIGTRIVVLLTSLLKNKIVCMISFLKSNAYINATCPAHKTKNNYIPSHAVAKSESFSSVASYIWNKLLCNLSSISILPAFRKRLNYHFFRVPFLVSK